MVQDLSKFDSRLRGLILIQGIGLCSNIYVIKGEDITLIDTGVGDENNRLDEAFRRLGLSIRDIKRVVLTHTHPDHFGGLLAIQAFCSPDVLVHRFDSHALEGLDLKISYVDDRDRITTSQNELKVIHTPGHTAGSICLVDEAKQILFSGDTVFPNGMFGRTDLSTGNPVALLDSLRKLSNLDIHSLLPGHEPPVIKDADSHIKLSYKVALGMLGS